ncbi:hypothetical protein PENTCL1PPCAC_28856 [Pristionchus entomophagus]|uniref:Peptidase M13 N-terminal domain-containing protein n=1 Tax=Pristionchus entomophagus TaxID=358040 RepID=A0AAV5UI92_9BILA|nr:hypothetical protein PENTCL1PPCAC_28856 [Pristionchus entomophagus]
MYFFNLYNKTAENVDDSLKFYSTHGNKTNRNIGKSVRATTRMIELLYEDSAEDFDFQDTIKAYLHLQDRLFVMEFFNSNNQSNRVGLDKIHTLTRQLKDVILRKFQETSWMNETNEFGFDILDQYMTILDEVTVLTDFDCFDRNLTNLRRINREVTAGYFENSKRCGFSFRIFSIG